MKSIMLSIQPQWVEKILNGDKTIEIRKTMPKCELPVKVYIYCTKDKKYEVAPFRFVEGWVYKKFDDNTHYCSGCTANMGECINGKVVAEFILNCIEKFDVPYPAYFYAVEELLKPITEKSCLSLMNLHHYLKNDTGYAWHIDDLKIYDKPKELSEFKKENKCYKQGNYEELGCWECGCTHQELGFCDGRYSKLERPPQSYCYCEELENEID